MPIASGQTGAAIEQLAMHISTVRCSPSPQVAFIAMMIRTATILIDSVEKYLPQKCLGQ